MKKIHVFDIDGTILGTKHMLDVLKTKYYSELTEDNFLHYDIGRSLKEAGMQGNIPTNQDFFVKHEELFLSGSELVEGIGDYVEMLEQNGVSFIFVTARHHSIHHLTIKNFKQDERLYKHIEKVFYVGESKDGLRVDIELEKEKLINKIGYNLNQVILYEDKIETINHFAAKYATVYLVDQPYNRIQTIHQNVLRIKDFKGLLDYHSTNLK